MPDRKHLNVGRLGKGCIKAYFIISTKTPVKVKNLIYCFGVIISKIKGWMRYNQPLKIELDLL
ncbi:hypothetical protein U876_18710 [Aeromonas hydrophila NJ-35]|nr:hypothetical protein V429_05265 [Aeromonas hydrophila pc104A]AJE38661.1 hypothetical protein V469_18085 [Aeromonas hydrophila J-1]AKJ37093.1 hypothetical protein U876_18710 [Aeromonas hydrophila NJ-35]ALZ81420.1 hypothetical protein AhyD4_18075 [Aeromonas hydrophila]OLN99039.1 hypothetical protein BS650_18860 [Aeromonas hydrophila]